MRSLSQLLTSRSGPILTGILVGVLAPVLVQYGNPGNMGICVACFSRDTAGALGMHRAAVVQYLRPEIPGFVLGALGAALTFGEWKPRGGSSPLIRFLLGMFAVIGALVFLGCPWRAYLRLAGGDWSAIAGIVGLCAGIGVGIVFLKRGFSLGRNRPAAAAVGWVAPVTSVVLLALLLLAPQFGRTPEGNPVGPVFFSEKGPGSQHAPWLLSLGAGLLIGFLAQRSRFCTVGALRDVVLLRDAHLMNGVLALVVTAAATNAVLGQFHAGFTGNPIAHDDTLWNFLGMALAGLAFTMAGGCPGRQVFLCGEGDGDATIFVAGMVVGAGVAHTFSLASSPAGPGAYGPPAVVAGLVVLCVLGWTMRQTPGS